MNETSIVTVVIFLSVRYFGLGLEQTPLSDYGMKMIPQEMAGHAPVCSAGASKSRQ